MEIRKTCHSTSLLQWKVYFFLNPHRKSFIRFSEFGDAKTFDLIPNGSNIAVTRENRLQYIQIVSHYRLSKQIKSQSEAFFDGLSEMIDTQWLR